MPKTYEEAIADAREAEAELALIAKTRRPTKRETEAAQRAYKAAAHAAEQIEIGDRS